MIGKKKFKRYLKHNNKKQIWRILISETDKLVLEERDPKTREVFFSCYDLSTKTKIFSNFQFEEKAWIGIEAVENDIIIFHFYRKPDMPHHKGFFAYDLKQKKILWQNETLTYFFSDNEKIIAFQQQFEGRFYVEIDLLTGDIISNLGEEYAQVNLLKEEAHAKKSYTDYLFPEVFNPLNEDPQFDCIRNAISDFSFSGQVEYIKKGDFLYFTFHEKKDEIFIQHFYIWDTANNLLFFSDVLNKNIPNYAVDSFFVYKKFLFLIKEKQIVEIILVNT
ncbi:MAG: DUF4905 domain-containing protein [Ignavibacteria bacterium]|nr:DUF4905 domain-containing protein [Ignavibacteria bacterium]